MNSKFLVTDCMEECYEEVWDATLICKGYSEIVECIQNEIGIDNPCYDCICEVIDDIGDVFGQDWHC